MISPERIAALMHEKGLSQSELARRVGISQSAIHKLVKGGGYGSKHLHRIARELGTTPAYLTGEINDPTEGAPPPAPEPQVQFVMMPMAMPSEDALADAFLGLLMASRRLDEDGLSRELAKRLPTVLRIAGAGLAVRPTALPAELPVEAVAPVAGHPEQQRA